MKQVILKSEEWRRNEARMVAHERQTAKPRMAPFRKKRQESEHSMTWRAPPTKRALTHVNASRLG